MRVLILRPEPGNAATAVAVTAMRLQALRLPLFEAVARAWTPPDPARIDAIVLTSAYAARLGGAGLTQYLALPVFAVGEATAAAAQSVGFTTVTVGRSDVADVVRRLPPGARVLHLTGDVHQPLGCAATTIAVYQMDDVVIDRLPPADVALVHSPRAGERLARLWPAPRHCAIVAISAAAAAACGDGWGRVVIAPSPRELAMLASLRGLCESDGDARH